MSIYESIASWTSGIPPNSAGKRSPQNGPDGGFPAGYGYGLSAVSGSTKVRDATMPSRVAAVKNSPRPT